MHARDNTICDRDRRSALVSRSITIKIITAMIHQSPCKRLYVILINPYMFISILFNIFKLDMIIYLNHMFYENKHVVVIICQRYFQSRNYIRVDFRF